MLKLSTKTGEDQHDDIYKSATDLLRMIGALVTSVLAYPFSVIDPTVYQRTPEQVIPKKDPKPELDEDTKKDTLPATASSEQSKVSIYKSLKTRLIGIEHIKHHLHDTFTSIPTCGAIDGKQDKTQWKSTTKLDTSDQLTAFLLPKGTIEVQLDYSEEGNLQTDVSRLRGVDRLVLKNAKTQDIISLDNPSPLSQIHTLVLEEVDFTEADLIKIAEKFPNIACFDLSHCVFEGKLDKLAQSHIVCFPHTSDPKTGKSSRTVKFHFSNAGDQYEDLNKILCGKSSYKAIETYYAQKAPQRPFHPAAPFITELGLFRYTSIKEGDIRGAKTKDTYTEKFFKGTGIVKVFSKIFPNMTFLDFEGCSELVLDPKTLQYFHSREGLPPTITRISFKHCSNLFKDDYPLPAIEAFLRALVSMEHVIEVNIENTAHPELSKAKMKEIVKSMMVHVQNILEYKARSLCYTDAKKNKQTFQCD